MGAVLGSQVADGPGPFRTCWSARECYTAAADPEAGQGPSRLVQDIRGELDLWQVPASLSVQESEAAALGADHRRRLSELIRSAKLQDRLVRRALLGTAPLGLISGAWLQWLSAPGNCHEEVVLAGLALYASDVDVGVARSSRGEAYLDLLRQMHLADYASPPARLAHDQRLADRMFHLPAGLLVMSRRPDLFFAELLGADLCVRNFGLPPAVAALRDLGSVTADWSVLDPGRDRLHDWDGGIDQSRFVVKLLLDRVGSDERRVSAGFAWTQGALAEWCELLVAELARLDPAHEMAELLMLRARQGQVYHHDFELDGRSLSAWMSESISDPHPLMQALAVSDLVCPGRPDSSMLVTGLVGEYGPMFRVFARDDLDVIERWIDALPDAGVPDVASVADSPRTFARTQSGAPSRPDRSVPASIREAYHLLQGRADPPARLAWAESYVKGWLARSQARVGADDHQLPAQWTEEGLRPWLLDQHDLHARQFEANVSVPAPSRHELIEATVQTAPLTLIDGSWLHGFTDYQHVSTEPGHFLFETYWDELGNGAPHLNHPRIYRELLDEMGVELPPTDRREFACSPRLEDDSFELPVYWLSVGRFPRTFMPEIFGLNLAMELSGVGGSYRIARINLQRYGFSTRFVDVHNTIDNVATGHAAWAADAVDALILAVGESHGQQAQTQAWQRVRVGFVSLDPPRGRRARRTQRRAQRDAIKAHGLP